MSNEIQDAEMVAVKSVGLGAVVKVDEPVKPKAALPDLNTLSPQQFAQLCLSAELFKDAKSFAQMAVKIKLGSRMGLDEATSLSSIIIVNGRISFTANLIAARIKQSGKYRYKVLKKTAEECSLEFWEKVDKWENGRLVFEWEKLGIENFSYKMAERAGLPSVNPTWKKYPEGLLFCRCLTAGARVYTPDLFVGVAVYAPEELDPTIPMTVNSEGEIQVIVDPDATPVKATVPKLTATKPASKDDLLSSVQEAVKKTRFDVGPLLDQYGVKDLESMSADQLKAANRVIQQKAGAK